MNVDDDPSAPAPRPTEKPGMRRRNHALWLGPLLVFTGAVSYFMVFARYPGLRDVPWLNLPWVLIGLIVSAAGVRRAFRRSAGLAGRLGGVFVLVVAVLLSGLFVFYVFHLSYQVPPPQPETMALETAPDFALTDPDGREVSLAQFAGTNLVLTFYRGYW